MKILNAYHLKIIALLAMIIDHLGIMFFPEVWGLRIIGRMAFVLYAFMLVEGFFYTKNIKKYILKIFIWAFISEIPYDLAIEGKWSDFSHQNIFFTLLIALIGIVAVDKQRNKFLKILYTFAFILFANIIKADYNWYGVSLIFLFYYLRYRRPYDFLFAEVLSMLSSFRIMKLQFFAFLAFIPIALYNGKPGRKTGLIYYSFYAGHLLLFAAIKYFF